MKNWEVILVDPELSLRDALEIIDKAGTRMVLVVDATRRLLGTLSDGDVRRGLLRGLTLTDKVAQSMHVNPTVAKSSAPCSALTWRPRPAPARPAAGRR